MAQTKIKPRQLEGGLDGWIPAEQTWTYASATTITVPSGAASKYQKGDKIKITNNSATKYFYIVSVADTVLTVTGGSDYTVHDSAITNPFFSKIENPQGFPHWFAYTPSFGGFSANPTGQFRFRVTGVSVFVSIRMSVSGTSNANTFTVSVPITSSSALDIFTAIPGIVDNGVTEGPNQCLHSNGTATLTMQRNSSSTGWTTSGAKRITGITVQYQMA